MGRTRGWSVSTTDEKVAMTGRIGGGRPRKKKWVLPGSRPEVAFVAWPNKDDALSQARERERTYW